MSDYLKHKLVMRACEIAGSRERLASRLDVEIHSLEFWLSGRATPPERVFLRVVDLVLEDDMARAVQDRRKNAVQRSVFGSWAERRAIVPPEGRQEEN